MDFVNIGWRDNSSTLCIAVFELSRTWHVLRLERSACSERCRLDLPGFENLEGLPIGLFLA